MISIYVILAMNYIFKNQNVWFKPLTNDINNNLHESLLI